MRTGLDTNVLIYALDNSDQQKHQKALEILKDVFTHPGNYTIATQVMAETIYVVKRKYPEATDVAVKMIRLLAELPALKMLTYGPEDVLNASQHNAFWDAILAYTYVKAGVSTILTENTEDYKDLLINAKNPFTR